jgi:signal transduction histidine kinase
MLQSHVELLFIGCYIYNTRVNYTDFIFPGACFIIVLLMILIFWLREKSIKEQEYEFITIVTHKFRTPLTGIKWAIEAFKGEVTHEQKEDILKQMENSNAKILEIVDLLAGFVKFDKKLEYAFEAASLHEMVQESMTKYGQYIRLRNIHFTIDEDQTIPMIIIDRRKIQFVIDMLIDNAIKYSQEGGSITVAIQQTPDKVLLSVQDSGIGLNFSDRKRLFKKFFRSDDAKTMDTEGMGMGLYTAQTIMRHHHGTLRAESEGRGKGTTFIIELNKKN